MPENPKESNSNNVNARMSSLGLDAPQEEEVNLGMILPDPVAFVLEQLAQDYDTRQITEKMVRAGVDSTYAANLVKQVDAEYKAALWAKRREQRSSGRRNLLAGAALIAIGAGVLVGSYQLAAPGGVYVAPVGLFLGGAYYFFKGAGEALGW